MPPHAPVYPACPLACLGNHLFVHDSGNPTSPARSPSDLVKLRLVASFCGASKTSVLPYDYADN